MSAFACVRTGILLSVGIACACAPKAERPPFTNSDEDFNGGPVVPQFGGPDAGGVDGETMGAQTSEGDSAATSEGADDGTGGEASNSSDPGTTAPASDVAELREFAGPTIWTNLERVIATSRSGQVYVTDFERVFQVVDGEPKILLSSEALALEESEELMGLAVDDTGNVHVFVQASNLSVAEDHIFDADGNPVEERPIAENTSLHYPTVSPEGDEVFYIESDGMHRSVDGTDELFLDAVALGGGSLGSSCGAEALTIGPEHIYYMPGCTGSPVYFGPRDGSSFGLLAEDEDIQEGVNGLLEGDPSVGFSGMIAHPDGGVIMNMEQLLVWIHDDGSWQLLSTAPWLGEAVEGNGSVFLSAPVAIDQFNVYLLADNQVWIADGLFD